MTVKSSFVFILYYLICLYRILALTPSGPTSPRDISCYNKSYYDKCSRTLPIIHKDFRAPNKTIFFIETSCKGGLQSKYACAVESAANANHNWHVIVLFAGPLKKEFLESKTFKLLNSIPNLYFYRINSTELALGTPLEELFVYNILADSKYPVVHAADLLRILILYLFGGLYLDLDMIVMRSFDTLPNNFIARQDDEIVASGIIAVAKDEVGKKFADISIRILADIFDGDKWSDALNELNNITLKEICLTPKLLQMSSETCQGFYVLDSEWFYPIHYTEWTEYYREAGMPMLLDIEAYTHHVWNSYGAQVKLAPDSFFTKLAEVYCPQTYNLYKDKFGQTLAITFDVDAWAANTIKLNTRTLKKMCSTSQLYKMNAKTCQGFDVLDSEWFYPIQYPEWMEYYKPGGMPKSLDVEAYTHHVWNSYGAQVKLAPDSYLSKLAEVYCPQTYNSHKDKFGQTLALTFDVDAWSANTVELNTRTLKELCSTSQLREMNTKTCQGFHVMNPTSFYPIHWTGWAKYYEQRVAPMPLDTEAYTHHVWNSYGRQVYLSPNCFFTRMAEDYCPQIYNLYKDKFVIAGILCIWHLWTDRPSIDWDTTGNDGSTSDETGFRIISGCHNPAHVTSRSNPETLRHANWKSLLTLYYDR